MYRPSIFALAFATACSQPMTDEDTRSKSSAIYDTNGRSTATSVSDRYSPRFIFEVEQFSARNESGIDLSGSDEIFGVFDAPGYRLITKTYGNVDSLTDHLFTQGNRCLFPAVDNGPLDSAWTCAQGGGGAPVTLIVALYENDSHDVFPPFGFCVQGTLGANDLWGPGATTCDFDPRHDDLIGREKLTFSKSELVKMMPKIGDSHVRYVSLFGGCDNSTGSSPCVRGGAGNPDPFYELRIRITRLQNVVLNPPVDPDPR